MPKRLCRCRSASADAKAEAAAEAEAVDDADADAAGGSCKRARKVRERERVIRAQKLMLFRERVRGCNNNVDCVDCDGDDDGGSD